MLSARDKYFNACSAVAYSFRFGVFVMRSIQTIYKFSSGLGLKIARRLLLDISAHVPGARAL
jgi:hypothetical protein